MHQVPDPTLAPLRDASPDAKMLAELGTDAAGRRRLFGRMTFQRQLMIVVAAGVFGLALIASVASSWQGSQQIRDTLLQQSQTVTGNLALQSRLALLSGSADNASDAVDAALSYPDVLRVEIRKADGGLLIGRSAPQAGSGSASASGAPGAGADAATAPSPLPAPPARQPYLEGETDRAWRFVAPVWTRPETSPFDVETRGAEFLGYVRVIHGKDTMRQLVANIFMTNLLVSLASAVLFLLAIRVLGQRVTRPLTELSRAMARAERGDADVRADVQGPRDIETMAHAFNSMIATLQERGDELQRHRGRLEELVRDRTAELRAAKDRAEVASQAKSAFLARMSHELRTPLNAILGYAQLLQMEPNLSDRQRTGVDTIHSSGEHLLMLIIDILDLSQIEAGKISLYPTSIAPKAFIAAIADIIRIRADQKQLRFDCLSSGDLPDVVEVDEKRLRQVLLNLLSNAVKFTDAGHVLLRLTLAHDRQGADGRMLLRFEVEDSGGGIPVEDHTRIFEPFEQAGDARSRAAGTGLGLAISRQLVRLMGGELRVDSRPGEGARFWFELPLVAGLGTAPAAPARRGEPGRINGYEGPRRKVLVVDDVRANRRMLADLLRPLGFETTEASDGQAALDEVAANRPDLIFMDLAMPGMDGLEATRRLRREFDAQALPVIALSAHASRIDRDAALDAGANAFIAKPFTRAELLDQLGRHLGLTWISEPPAESAGQATYQ